MKADRLLEIQDTNYKGLYGVAPHKLFGLRAKSQSKVGRIKDVPDTPWDTVPQIVHEIYLH